MIISSYNFSSTLKESLSKIEKLREQISVFPLSPKNELRLKWEASLQRIYWSLSLTPNSVSKQEMINLLSRVTPNKLSQDQREVINYQKAMDYITQEWIVSPTPVSFSAIEKLNSTYSKGLGYKNPNSFIEIKKDVTALLSFLQTGNEHPVIQAGIVQINMIMLSSLVENRGCLARLIPYLFLYKSGYNFRNLLVLDEYYRRDLVTLKDVMIKAEKTNNITLWLEYFVGAIVFQLTKTLSSLESGKFQTDVPKSFWKLNSRQKEIIGLLDNPDLVITNKDIQKMFKISQITASRDLSKLTKLGLLFPYGKGRSTYYLKV